MNNFILYSEVSADQIEAKLGLPQYSYYFVKIGFERVLRELGKVHLVDDIEAVDTIVDSCLAAGDECVFLSIAPPNRSPTHLRCPTICVFAWEFEDIPYETTEGSTQDDWRIVLRLHGRTISLSNHTANVVRKAMTGNVVRKAMGWGYPVRAIPVPVWDRFKQLYHPNNTLSFEAIKEFSIEGNVLDSRNYIINEDFFQFIDWRLGLQVQPWDGERIAMGFTANDEQRSYLGGFYPSELWGAWSRISTPWIFIPYTLIGPINVTINAAAFGPNVGKTLTLKIGEQALSFTLTPHHQEVTLSFDLKQPQHFLFLSGFDLSNVPTVSDPRTMAIGLTHIIIERKLQPCLSSSIDAVSTLSLKNDGSMNVDENSLKVIESKFTDETVNHRKSLELSGVVYTTVFNPIDSRKNWEDILTAFCYAFRDNANVTLLLKVTHHSIASIMGKFHYLLHRLQPMCCRVVVVQGYFDDVDYERLVDVTTFYVNASSGEGACTPVMEFMAAGKPTIAPRNTAMLDVVDEESSFVVKSSKEPSTWPGDPRQVIRTIKYRIDWESLVDCYKRSFELALSDAEGYRTRAAASHERVKKFCSDEAVKEKLKSFLRL